MLIYLQQIFARPARRHESQTHVVKSIRNLFKAPCKTLASQKSETKHIFYLKLISSVASNQVSKTVPNLKVSDKQDSHTIILQYSVPFYSFFNSDKSLIAYSWH